MSLQEKGQKMQETGKKVQKAGGVLTVLLTIPILLTIFLGIPGLIIGSLVFIFGAYTFFKKKEPKNEGVS